MPLGRGTLAANDSSRAFIYDDNSLETVKQPTLTVYDVKNGPADGFFYSADHKLNLTSANAVERSRIASDHDQQPR